MPIILSLLAFSLIAVAEDPDTTAPDEAAEPQGTRPVYRALSRRDGGLSCDEIEALTETPVTTLMYIVDNAKQPPWAPMRAAECLTLNHHAELQPHLQRWLTQPETTGLAIMVVNHLDDLPLETAQRLATISLEGPLAEELKTRINRLKRDQIKKMTE